MSDKDKTFKVGSVVMNPGHGNAKTISIEEFKDMHKNDYVEPASKRAARYRKPKQTNTPTTTPYVACWESHEPLKIAVDGTDYFVTGGSCTRMNDRIKEADVFIGLDHGMVSTDKEFPWTEGVEFRYLITDMCAPKSPANFKMLISWLADQIMAGKRVHIGCIGGHGRTGTVLSALVAHMTGEKDAIQYVRKNYCKKAVESETQIKFLMKHFGVSNVPASKAPYTPPSGSKYGGAGNQMPLDDWYGYGAAESGYRKPRAPSVTRIVPVSSKGSIWK
jgi:protein-tyrosine phosphatase